MGVYKSTEQQYVRTVLLKHRFCANVLVRLITCTVTSHDLFRASIFPLSLKDL
jgi:hypothetical protein